MDIPQHVRDAIAQARKEGHKGVRGFVGNIEEHNKYTQLKNEGKLETFTQRYVMFREFNGTEHWGECVLMRKPKQLN